MTVRLKTYNEMLGDWIRKVIIDANLNDVNTGSVLLTLGEATIDSDFENQAAILSVLNLNNLDALNGADLDRKGAEYGIVRLLSQKAVGKVTITDSLITKQSSSLYYAKLPPIKGSTKIYVIDAAGWANSGSIYIGRGTTNFEGPISYSSITNNTTFYTLNLSTALNNDHLISEEVTNSQGTVDRVIPSGTIVRILANSQTPEIQYKTIRQATISAGEESIVGVDIVAMEAGSLSNISKNTITSFLTSPFMGATVTNPSAIRTGKDREADEPFRDRIKNFAISLVKGTKEAIRTAVIGISDLDENKQVTSAKITEPINLNDPSTLYIDDSTGFQPSYDGQPYDTMIQQALGGESFVQLTNYPLPRPQVVSLGEAPFQLKDMDKLTVSVDGMEEIVIFYSEDFHNIAFATIVEVMNVINNPPTGTVRSFSCRLADNSTGLLIYPIDELAEKIQVIAPVDAVAEAQDANVQFNFPTVEKYSLKLYKNNVLLKEKERSAAVYSLPFASWSIVSNGSIELSVDGTTIQTISIYNSDFPTSSFLTATLTDWVNVLNLKIAGVTASSTVGQQLVLTSNKSGSSSSIEITGGTYLTSIFDSSAISSTGQSSDYALNRQNGTIELTVPLVAGDLVVAGAEDIRGYVLSLASSIAQYDIDTDSFGTSSNLVFIVDAKHFTSRPINLNIGDTVVVDDSATPLIKITSSSLSTFMSLLPGDYIYINSYAPGSWLTAANCGLYKIAYKGNHTTLADAYIQVYNMNGVADTATVFSPYNMTAFYSDTYPQIWSASSLTVPLATASLINIVASMNAQLVNISSMVYQGDKVKSSSTSEDNGSIALAVVTGKARSLWPIDTLADFGNVSHRASKVTNKAISSYFKRTTPAVAPYATAWGRYTYKEVTDTLTGNTISDNTGLAGYQDRFSSSQFNNASYDDYINFIENNNKEIFKTIMSFPISGKADTQYDKLKTLFHNIGGYDYFNIFKMAELSDNDSLVIAMDKDNVYKKVDISMFRAGKVNSGSGGAPYLPTTNALSADDIDNEPGIDFSNSQVWSKTLTGAEFKDYAVWMRARNWYSTGGAAATDGQLIVRSSEYGPHGEKIRFQIEYPIDENKVAEYDHTVNPDYALFTYYFGSTPQLPTGIGTGTTIAVSSLGGYSYRYTFTAVPAVNFTSVNVGDIINLFGGSGVSANNRGIFRITNVGANFLDLTNFTGAITGAGSIERTTIAAVADVPGTPSQFSFNVNAMDGSTIDGKYFIVEENAGTTKYWYDTTGSTIEPVPGTTTRSIKINTVATLDTNLILALKTAYSINVNSQIAATVIGTLINCLSLENGFRTLHSAGNSTYTLAIADAGTAVNTLDGTFFIIGDSAGLVKVWFATSSITPEPIYGLQHRSLRVQLASGDTAGTVANAISFALNTTPLEFTSSVLVSTVTADTVTPGARVNAYDSVTVPTGFTIGTPINGVNPIPETITTNNTVKVYSLDTASTATAYMSTLINQSLVIQVIDLPTLNPYIVLATRDESVICATGHDPDPTSGENYYIPLWDGENWVKTFSNSNPNFIFKKNLVSANFPSAIYTLNSVPNWATTDIGEYFKLIPRSIDNVEHHLTHKALSQLALISDVDIAYNRQRVQIKSQQIGSAGAVDILGGSASNIALDILGNSQIETFSGVDYLKVYTNAYPFVFNIGDSVEVGTSLGTIRRNILDINDTMVVTEYPTLYGTKKYEYKYDPKAEFTIVTQFSIEDKTLDAAYFGPTSPVSGVVWRYYFDIDPTGLTGVVPGDVLIINKKSYPAFLTLSATNTYGRSFGDKAFPGYPIVGVKVGSPSYIDIINPFGVAEGVPGAPNLAIDPATDYVAISPAPATHWRFRHSAAIEITGITYTGSPSSVATVTTATDHNLNVGDTISILFNNYAPYVVVITEVVSPNTFRFNLLVPGATLLTTTGRVLKAGQTWTKYRLQKMGFKDLVKLSWASGDKPEFTYFGVAIDDYVTISGQTFNSGNLGTFRVRGVSTSTTEDYIIFENKNAVENVNSIIPMNLRSAAAIWTNNSNIVTGSGGTFENVSIGTWIKKVDDNDMYYQQVLSFNTGTGFLDTTSISLASPYRGTNSYSQGVVYNEIAGVNAGVYLSNPDDITVYEGDSASVGDTISIAAISNIDWFNANNTGSYEIIEVGTDTSDNKILLRVYNDLGVDADTAKMSVSTDSVNIYEGIVSRYSSIREIANIAFDPNDINKRIVYLYPSDRGYKISEENTAFLSGAGKLNYSNIISVGIDGYEYYTGLLRRVQRTVDGFNLDPTTYPGLKGVGTRIEILPPLIRKLDLSLNVTFKDGINISDVTDSVKVVMSNYINGLGAGEDVILSEIIAEVMKVKGVEAATFTDPVPSTERFLISEYEKAFIDTADINIA